MKTTILLKTGLCASMTLVAWAGTPAALATPAAPAASAPVKLKASAPSARKSASGITQVPARAASTLGGGKKGPTRPTGVASGVTQ
jgi:hypothetical protein